ncbi:MAG: polymerase, sigma-24 subunit, subfamily [Armatimonadetes bacterium]|nr:polymerase, sigma-24 subunit, subfamily [Armatimonadota bacterium]
MNNRWIPSLAGKPAYLAHDDAPDPARVEPLLQAAQRGDRAALERLLSERERALYLLCFSILGRREDAEDAVQETFLRAVRALGSFGGRASVRAWLTRIAINVCLEQKRRGRTRIVTEPLAPDAGAPHPSPETEVLDRLSVFEALASLQPRARAILVLKQREGWTAGEIALAMRCTERQVYHELQKAYRALAAWRAAHPEEGLL